MVPARLGHWTHLMGPSPRAILMPLSMGTPQRATSIHSTYIQINNLAYFQSKLNPEIDPTCRLCVEHTGGLTNPRPWRGRCRAGYSNTGGPPLPRKRAPLQKNTYIAPNFPCFFAPRYTMARLTEASWDMHTPRGQLTHSTSSTTANMGSVTLQLFVAMFLDPMTTSA